MDAAGLTQRLVKRTRGRPGALALITADGITTVRHGCGPEADFEIGSISKGVTGLLYHCALERGEVTADTQLGQLLPLADSPAAAIRLADLATHRSGLPRRTATDLGPWIGWATPHPALGRSQPRPGRWHPGVRRSDGEAGAGAADAHDFYNAVLKKGKTDPAQEVKVARITAVVIGVLAIVGGIAANGQNIAFLVSLAFAVAACANLPSILMTLYWKRFTTRGSVWSIYTGLLGSILLIVFSPAISSPTWTNPVAWFPLTSPTIVALPLAFLAGIIGTLTSRSPADPELQAEMEVRSLTGAGVAEVVAH